MVSNELATKARLYRVDPYYRQIHYPDGSLRDLVVDEPPIRELMDRINMLPFVYTTTASCSGHVLGGAMGFFYLTYIPGEESDRAIAEFHRSLNRIKLPVKGNEDLVPKWETERETLEEFWGKRPRIGDVRVVKYDDTERFAKVYIGATFFATNAVPLEIRPATYAKVLKRLWEGVGACIVSFEKDPKSSTIDEALFFVKPRHQFYIGMPNPPRLF